MPFYNKIRVGGKDYRLETTISGTVPPTTETEGNVGQQYLDVSEQRLYVCISNRDGVYTWTEAGGSYAQGLTVTCGKGGDFATLNDALTYCSRKSPVFSPATFPVNIVITQGTVITEQVKVYATDLSFIKISSETETVEVRHSSEWTGNRDETRYNVPLFEGVYGARLPVIGTKFVLASDNSDTNGYACGMVCDRASVGVILNNCGFQSFFDGIIANNNSEITCRNGWLYGMERFAAHSRHISRVSVRGAYISAGWGDHRKGFALYANRESMIDARDAWLEKPALGICAMNNSSVNANDATFYGLTHGQIAYADVLSRINCSNCKVEGSSNMTEDVGGDGYCFEVKNGGQITVNGIARTDGTMFTIPETKTLYSQEVNTLTGDGVIFKGSGYTEFD